MNSVMFNAVNGNVRIYARKRGNRTWIRMMILKEGSMAHINVENEILIKPHKPHMPEFPSSRLE